MDEALDRLGELLVRGLRSHALGLLDDLARGQMNGSGWREQLASLASLTEEQRWQVRDALIDCVDCGLEEFLRAVRQSGASVVIDGLEVGTSDVDLVTLMFGPGGWVSRYSRLPAYGMDAEPGAAADGGGR